MDAQSEKWVLPVTGERKPEALPAKAAHCGLQKPDPSTGTLLFYSPESCVVTRCGEVGVQGAPAARRSFLTGLGDSRRSLCFCFIKISLEQYCMSSVNFLVVIIV